MVNNSKEGVKQRATVGFNGELRILLRTSEIPHMYEVSRQKILQSFDRWLKNGSGWVLESVEGLTLHTAEYVSPSGSSYIETPEFIAHKKSIVNVINEDENCFKYAVTAALVYPWNAQKNGHRPSTYTDFLDKLDYTNCSTPMQIDDITKFEKIMI